MREFNFNPINRRGKSFLSTSPSSPRRGLAPNRRGRVLAVAAYRQLADACGYPLHLGITEAGALRGSTVNPSIWLGMLLWSGISDTIRVSLSAHPVEEGLQPVAMRLGKRRGQAD